MKDLMTIQMTPQEYLDYRNYQKSKKELQEQSKQKDDLIANLRDTYYREFMEKQNWLDRATNAESKLNKLIDIVHSGMPAKTKLEALVFEIEEVYKDRGYKHD